ncbi:ATP synthase F1 subunit epsilon [Mycoplasma sp. 1018B]|uniref:ATP synthase F1 subunit epsilon n=1 Tax=Mycoplasma sp. 1018B TaxID=2967302 RepID=UPI00211CD239|nr:ATP synthase F1 subunit epsilon [Mycoplasma sp. 1018B]UUM19100.1 ATP synthase F1 subunit epsilon [Mycoplasma sp. 1018B]
MNTIKLKIITVYGIFFEDYVISVNLKTKIGGEITLLVNHSPFVANIDICKMSILTKENKKLFYSIGDGFLQTEPNVITIITDDILSVDEINIKRAQEEQKHLMDALERTKDSKEKEMFQYKLRKVLNRIELYNQKY